MSPAPSTRPRASARAPRQEEADATEGLPRAALDAGVRVGIGGWTYEPWRSNFYPEGLPQSQELPYASERLTAIEVNGTYYRLQTPRTFAKWRDDTPGHFMFSLKAPRYATNRRVLAEAGEAIEAFVGSGLAKLGDKLGPIVWQFAPTKAFEPGDFEAFMRLLPRQVGRRELRHVLDVRHPSFMAPEYLDLARRHRLATVFADSDEYPSFADVTGDLVYARLMKSQARLKTGYGPQAIDQWARHAQAWAEGREPEGLPRVEPPAATQGPRRDVFIFFINGAKERAPAGAMALLKRLG